MNVRCAISAGCGSTLSVPIVMVISQLNCARFFWFYAILPIRVRRVHMDDNLQPGVDRPRRMQYVIVIIVIVLLSAAAYFFKRGASA